MVRRRPPRQHLARRGPRREAYDRVLIVCEGECTEPLYFQDLMARYRLSTAGSKSSWNRSLVMPPGR